MEQFGITEDLSASGKLSFKPGIQKGVLREVKAYEKESKKGEKYFILQFNFVDMEGKATFEKVEFIPKSEKGEEKYKKAINAFNVRVKHIYEAYATFPKAGVGVGAKDWDEYFTMIADAFNKNGKDSTPIYKPDGKFVPVHLKLTYNLQDNLDFPYAPAFIEVVREGKETKLTIDKKWDKVEQTGGSNNNSDTTFTAANPADMEDFLK